MDALEALRAKIPQFPGYGDDIARRDADELVRSYAGEALSDLNMLHPQYFAADPNGYEALLMRAGFMNQAAFKAFEYANLSTAQEEAMAVDDLTLVQLADRARGLAQADVGAYVAALTVAFDKRDATMESGGRGK